ncbi:Tkp3 protein [Phytophthora palmivora]|uniref:Tkp3 protein n=1 Tax=Phytophthora palmivora TaxID=4796 RepID=A0A2P4YGB5_9STRA|nr:Tkp3 protein [Phytophthora palmivora]
MSTANHPQTDGQTERVNLVLEGTLQSICAEALRSWSDHCLSLSSQSTMRYTHQRVHPVLTKHIVGRKAFSSQVSDIESASLKRQLS